MTLQDQLGIVGPHGELLDYSRISTTGYPYIGNPRLLPDDQLQQRSRQHYRFGCGLFSSARPSERIYQRTYGEIMENVCNSVFKLVYKSEPKVAENREVTVYIEWIEPYMVDVETPVPPRQEEASQVIAPPDADETSVASSSPEDISSPGRVFRRVKPLKVT